MRNKIIIISINLLFTLILYFVIDYLEEPFVNITGNVIGIENNKSIYDNEYSFYDNLSNYIEFNAKFSDDIINHDSWHIGGLGNNNFDSSDKVVFYVDVGVITPYLQINNKRYWCKPLIKNWMEYHLFKIIVDNKTRFFIDNEELCTFNIIFSPGLRGFIGENDKSGTLIMYVGNVSG